MQYCWDKFFDASRVQNTQQAKKFYTSWVLYFPYLFILNWL